MGRCVNCSHIFNPKKHAALLARDGGEERERLREREREDQKLYYKKKCINFLFFLYRIQNTILLLLGIFNAFIWYLQDVLPSEKDQERGFANSASTSLV